MALATLSIDFVALLAKMEQGFEKANRISEKFAADQERRFSAVKGAATAIGVALAGAFSVSQLATFARATIDGLDALNDLKDATGASIENIGALEDVAARTGTSFESMSSTLVKFNKVLSDSKPGSETANTIKLLGLNAEELKKIDPAEALRQTAVALAGFADDGKRARIVQELFGKSVAEAAPFLKDLAEQGKLNATVTTEQAQAAEDFNKAMASLQKNVSDASRSLLSELVPAMASVLATFNDKGLRAAVDEFGERVFGWTSNQQRKEIKRVQSEIEDLREEFEKWDGVPAQQKRVTAAIDENLQKLAELNRAYLKLNDGSAGGGRGSVNPAMVRQSIGDAPGATPKGLKKRPDDKKEQVFYDMSALDGLIERNRELSRVIESTPTAKLEKLRQLQQDLAAAYEDGRFGIVGSQEALDAYIETVNTALPAAMQTALPELEKLADESSEFFREAARNIQDAMGDSLVDVLEGNFDDIGKKWEQLLIRMAAQAAAAQLNKELFGSNYGSSGQIGGLIGSIFGGGSGASTGPTIGGGAEGGYVVPGAAGGGRMSAMRAGPVVNQYITNNIGQGVSRGEVEAAVRAGNAQTQESIRRSLSQGRYS